MTRLRALLLLAAAALALAAIQATMPDYARLRGPIVTEVPAGQTGTGIAWRATLTGLHLTPVVVTGGPAGPLERTTGGVWLIAHIRLEAIGDAPAGVVPAWHGPSGRIYAPSRRIAPNQRLTSGAMAVPGAGPVQVDAIFELPPEDVEGGILALGANLVPGFDAELRMTPPAAVQARRYDAEAGAVR